MLLEGSVCDAIEVVPNFFFFFLLTHIFFPIWSYIIYGPGQIFGKEYTYFLAMFQPDYR